MRKIESQMCKAIQNNLNWSSGNTQVVTNDGISTVYLHGNKIALVDDTSMTIFDGGYQSTTTKSRLNALINEFCNGLTDGVFQKDFLWWIRDNNEVKPFTSGYIFAWHILIWFTLLHSKQCLRQFSFPQLQSLVSLSPHHQQMHLVWVVMVAEIISLVLTQIGSMVSMLHVMGRSLSILKTGIVSE